MPARVLGVAVASLVSSFAAAQDVKVDFEVGQVWQTRNTCAVPSGSTRFSYRDLLGRGPFPISRTTITLSPDATSGYRFVWAPLRLTGNGQLDKNITFDGKSFAPGVDTYGEYMFNNYRATWWKRWRSSGSVRLRSGYTLFIRDARVSLAQGANRASFYNLGVVPLAYVAGEVDLSRKLIGEFEFDGLLSPYGGAIDTGLTLGYRTSRDSVLKLKCRVLDGGTSRGSAYSFATFVTTSVGFEWRW